MATSLIFTLFIKNHIFENHLLEKFYSGEDKLRLPEADFNIWSHTDFFYLIIIKLIVNKLLNGIFVLLPLYYKVNLNAIGYLFIIYYSISANLLQSFEEPLFLQ